VPLLIDGLHLDHVLDANDVEVVVEVVVLVQAADADGVGVEPPELERPDRVGGRALDQPSEMC